MPINPFSHLRLLNTTQTTQTLSLTKTSLSVMKPHTIKTTTTTASCCRNPHALSRIFPFKLKYLALSRPLHRPFSTRPRQPVPRQPVPRQSGVEFRGSGFGSGSGPKSLIEDEAELSDWVSELRTSSNLRGRVTSDEEESESFGARRKGRTRTGGGERERDGFSVKRRRGEEKGSFSRSDLKGKRWELGNDGEREWSRSERRGGVDTRGDKRRGPFFRRGTRFGSDLDDKEEEEEEEYGSRRGSQGNVSRRNGMRGGRERGLGLKRDGRGAVGGRRGFSDDDDSDSVDSDGRKMLMKGIGDLLSEEDSDDIDEVDDGDTDVDNNVRSSFGFEKEFRAKSTTISSGKSDSYLSETR